MNTIRKQAGSARIVCGNNIEAVWIALNLIWLQDVRQLKDYLCNFHTNKFNNEKYSRVPILSGIVTIIHGKLLAHVAIPAYTRQSEGDFENRVDTIASAVEHVFKYYKKVDLWRHDSIDLLQHISTLSPAGRTP